jgi:low affinity Fe/Cu permease
MASSFARIAARVAIWTGHYLAFLTASLIIITWAITGPIFSFSDTWQLVINTGTTIITFLMVFLIQNTQNRDALAVHLKLDEIIRSIETADNAMMRAEDGTDEELARLKHKYQELSEAHEALKARLQAASDQVPAGHKPAA